VNAGGDPERDDSGLPPVDIEIPDDARELDRDVHAYLREMRALRRRQRASRLRTPLTREGMVLPLLAGCLVLALITSTLLIMFAADQTGVPQSLRHAAAQRRSSASRPAAGQINGPLPAAVMLIGGRKITLSSVTSTKPTVLTLVPPDCGCAPTLRQLSIQAARAHVPVYLVVKQAAPQQLAQIASQAGQSSAQVAQDTGNVLATTYRAGSGLTAILVRQDGLVASVARQLPPPPGLNLQTQLQGLSSAKSATR